MNVIQQEPQFPEYEGINYEDVTNLYIDAMKVGGKSVVETLQGKDAEHIKENVETVQKVTGMIYGGQQAALRLERDERGISYPTLATKEFETEYEKEVIQKEVEAEQQVEEQKEVEAEQKAPKKEENKVTFSDQIEAMSVGAPQTYKHGISGEKETYCGYGSKLTEDLRVPAKIGLQETGELSTNLVEMPEEKLNFAKGMAKERKEFDQLMQVMDKKYEKENQRENKKEKERDNGQDFQF